jgi:hypothetical protein
MLRQFLKCRPFRTDNTACPAAGAAQAYCDFSGFTVFFQVSGTNSVDTSALTDASGIAKITYSDSNGAGTDTVTACVDIGLFPPAADETSAAECLADASSGSDFEMTEDIASSPVNEYWVTTFLSLSPATKINAVGGMHTVTPSPEAFWGNAPGEATPPCPR